MRWMIPLLLCVLFPSLSFASVDSDGDEVIDNREIIDGTNPNDPLSFDPLSRGLLAHYQLNGSGSDASGFNRDATNFGSNPTENRFGSPNQALTFDGNDYLQTPVDSNLNTVTLSAWFASDTRSGERSIVDSDNGGPFGHSLILGYSNSDNTLDVQFHDGFYNSPWALNDNGWHHAVAVIEPSIVRLYVDGKLVGSQSYSRTSLDGSQFRIGRHNAGDPQWFKGQIDDVRIYNRPLSADEVVRLFQQESGEATLAAGTTSIEIIQGSYTWNQAKADAVNRGGRLAVFPTGDVYDRTASKIRSTFSGYFWLGGSDAEQEGVWRWIDGTPITYGRWQAGEPNNQGGTEDSLHVVVGNTIWNDATNDGEGNWRHAYALEKRPLSLLSLPFVAQGAQWSVDYSTAHDDFSSAKAQTTDGQSTYREYTVTGPAVVDFWWKVSSQQEADYFSYSLNGVSQEAISGDVNWTSRTLILPAGTHTIRWTYNKDGSGSVGQDAGWLDDLRVRYLPTNGDEDSDGLSNTEEANLGTNPYLRDTDSDGVNDLREALDHTDPLDPASFDSLNKGLVAYFPFEGNSSDQSGSGRNGLNVGVAFDENTLNGGLAARFNGQQRIEVDLTGSRPQRVTLSVWVQPTTDARHGSYYVLHRPSYPNGFTQWHIGWNKDNPPNYNRLGSRLVFNEENNPFLKTEELSKDQWYHVVTTFDGTTYQMFVNGALVDSMNAANYTLLYLSDILYIGWRENGAEGFTGRVDDVRIYERALSPSEVASVYANERYGGAGLEGAATKSPFDPATAANWNAGGTEWSVDASVTHDGVDSVKAQTTDGQSTYREYTVTGPAVVDFWWKVSSEQLYDTFSYSVNGVNQQTISGEVDWTYRTHTLPAGTHTIRWTYTKDGSDAVGQDAGWLDDFAVYPATATLQVRDGATVLSGTTTVGFGSADLGSTGFTKTLTFANDGYVPLEVQLSLPQGSPFTFDGGASTYDLLIGRGESVAVPITLATTAPGNKSVQLVIDLPSYNYPPYIGPTPQITLAGYVRGPDIGLTQGATTLTSGQTFDMGLAPRTVEFTIRNNGNVGDLVISAISATGNFQITQQPATTVPPQGSTTFKVLAQSVASGIQVGSISITSNAANLAVFILPLSSKSLTGIAQGITDGSMATSGTGGAVGWDFATTQLPSGQNGQALKTGATPNAAASVLQLTTQTAGIVSWSWKVGSQENFDWLLCEVDGQEVAGISTKNGIWQTQVVQVPAGANVRWVYHKDASASAGEDAGYLTDVEFRSFAANQSFGRWADTYGLYDPQQRLPKSGMKTKFAWLGGFDPAASLTAGHHVPIMEGGRLKYRFPISKTADGMQQVLFSPDMASWTTRRFSQRVVSEDADRIVIEATAPSGTRGFFKVVGGGDTSGIMVRVQGGTLPQSSELAGTVVATFRIGRTEVTWEEWQEVSVWAVANGYADLAGVGAGSGGDHPVRSVSWYDVVKWSNAKSEKEGLTPFYRIAEGVYRTGQSAPTVNRSADGYRLPTEAEWEWAARGGVNTQGYIYSGSNDVDAVAWYTRNSSGGTKAVGTKAANELGIYDMSGNAWEWCEDFSYYGSRLIRGGGTGNQSFNCAVSFRYDWNFPDQRFGEGGFRLARNAD